MNILKPSDDRPPWSKGRRLALSGTPGTGKSRVGRSLGKQFAVEEVGALALRVGAGATVDSGVEVSLGKLARWFVRHPDEDPRIVVGHLAHLLPIRDVVVLRCHPIVLKKRLEAQPRENRSDLQENLIAEALDVVTFEARERNRRVWEIDTTHASPRAIADEITRIVRTRPAPRAKTIDWLSDPEVTAHLLDR